MRHIRSVEWASVFQEPGTNDTFSFPDKLKLIKLNRPNKEDLDEKTQVYCEMIQAKLRSLKPKVRENFYKKNNLDPMLKKALQELISYTKNKEIVICRTDKDGRIIVVNFKDYKSIMQKELQKFDVIKDFNVKNTQEDFDKVRVTIEKMMTELYEEDFIDDKMLSSSM